MTEEVVSEDGEWIPLPKHGGVKGKKKEKRGGTKMSQLLQHWKSN